MNEAITPVTIISVKMTNSINSPRLIEKTIMGARMAAATIIANAYPATVCQIRFFVRAGFMELLGLAVAVGAVLALAVTVAPAVIDSAVALRPVRVPLGRLSKLPLSPRDFAATVASVILVRSRRRRPI